jgi:glycerophosphoryl diester phosphodiesterase
MRSSRSAPDPLGLDPLWPGPAGFAHRGLHYGARFPENSLTAFAAALEMGAGIACDLRLTADGQVVVFHDADAMRMCGSPLVIGQSSAADLQRLKVGEHPVPTLSSLLALVAGRVPLLLEIKANRDQWRWAPALKKALLGYSGPFGLMSFDPRIIRLMKTNLPEARRGLVIRDDLSPLRRRLALWLSDPQFAAVQVTALGKPWVSRLRLRMPVYTWTVRSIDQLRQAAVHADAPIWEADGRPRI